MTIRDQYNTKEFENGLHMLGISLCEAQMEQFLLYYEMLTEWNQRMNLTAITGFADVTEKHFLDSLCLVKAVPELRDQRIMDVGTGAGFPGIPLKIAFPGLDVVMIDSVGKKLHFVDELIKKLGLSNAKTVHGRAEDLGREAEYRQQFDLCVSRAVSNLSVLAEYCLPFVKTGGRFVAYKSADVKEECEQAAKAVTLFGGEMALPLVYSLPGREEARSLICIQKNKGTPREYPRKAGIPARDPVK